MFVIWNADPGVQDADADRLFKITRADQNTAVDSIMDRVDGKVAHHGLQKVRVGFNEPARRDESDANASVTASVRLEEPSCPKMW